MMATSPKQTVVTMNYQDALGNSLSNESRVDLEKYNGILHADNNNKRRIVTELHKIGKRCQG